MTEQDARELVLCVRDWDVKMLNIEGYRAAGASAILENLFEFGKVGYLPRGMVEEDESWRQLVAYSILLRESDLHVWAYPREKGQGEVRLHGRISIGVGGHVGIEDYSNSYFEGPIAGSHLGSVIACAGREVKEETGLRGDYQFQMIGLIDDRSTPVARVHLGVVFLVSIPSSAWDRGPIMRHVPGAAFVPWSTVGSHDVQGNLESWSSLLWRAHAVPAALSMRSLDEPASAG
jgi:predicted NUDIX family phosphoesterase